MTTIDAVQRDRECDALLDAAIAARRDQEQYLAALHACIAHPCAYHELDLPELYAELGQTFFGLGRYDDSIEALEASVAAGARRRPHPRMRVADVLLNAGRHDEAAALYEELRRQYPDDIWLYATAGHAYRWAGEPARAIPWLEAGIEMALADGDVEDLLYQLADERGRCRYVLGLPESDELTARVTAFEAPVRSSEIDDTEIDDREPIDERSFGDAFPDRSQCAHCGWDPQVEPPAAIRLGEVAWLLDHLDEVRQADGSDPLRATEAVAGVLCQCGSGGRRRHYCGW